MQSYSTMNMGIWIRVSGEKVNPNEKISQIQIRCTGTEDHRIELAGACRPELKAGTASRERRRSGVGGEALGRRRPAASGGGGSRGPGEGACAGGRRRWSTRRPERGGSGALDRAGGRRSRAAARGTGRAGARFGLARAAAGGGQRRCGRGARTNGMATRGGGRAGRTRLAPADAVWRAKGEDLRLGMEGIRDF